MSWCGVGAAPLAVVFIRRLLRARAIHFASAAFVLLATFFAAPPASAQLAPNQTIRIIVPFAPAGSSDTLARLLQQPLQQELNQTVIVENRAGAGTNIGTAEVARATPDGLTLLLTSSALPNSSRDNRFWATAELASSNLSL